VGAKDAVLKFLPGKYATIASQSFCRDLAKFEEGKMSNLELSPEITSSRLFA
jgi:hypothetical protein